MFLVIRITGSLLSFPKDTIHFDNEMIVVMSISTVFWTPLSRLRNVMARRPKLTSLPGEV
jgi:hypothetical protein